MIEKYDTNNNLITIRNFYNGAIITQASIESNPKLLAAYSNMNESIVIEMKMLKDRNDGKKYYVDVTNNNGHNAIVSHSEAVV
jgi:hypothetical protein